MGAVADSLQIPKGDTWFTSDALSVSSVSSINDVENVPLHYYEAEGGDFASM